jgi:hypothetical protein
MICKVRIPSIPINYSLIITNFIISATKTAIILKDSKDWPKWFAVTISSAQEHGLVPYINLYKCIRDLAVLEELIRPTVASIRPHPTAGTNISSQIAGATPSGSQDSPIIRESSTTRATETQYKDLNESEQAQLHLETQIYLHKLKSYKEHTKAMGRLQTKVIETTHPNNFHYILNKDSVYDMLVLLKNQFTASDYARKQKYTIE